MRMYILFSACISAAFAQIDVSHIDSAEDFLKQARESATYAEFLDQLLEKWNRGENETLEFVQVEVSKSFLDNARDDSIRIVQGLKDSIFDDLAQQNGDVSDGLRSIVPSEVKLSTCIETNNGDSLRLTAFIQDLHLKVNVESCGHVTSVERNAEYLVSLDDLHCNIRIPANSSFEQLVVELGPEQCKTVYWQTNSTLGIRNRIHLYQASFVEDMITGVTEDNATISSPISFGREFDIETTANLDVLFGDYSKPEEPLKPCETGDNRVTCYGRLQAGSQMWTDNTFTELREHRKSFTLGEPIFFSIKPMLKVPGIYFNINHCAFGADGRNFRFLRENGCLFKPLNAASYDEFVTATGTSQRFQFDAFMFTGPPFTGLQLQCNMKMCIRMGQQNTCPDLEENECEQNFENGEK